MNLDSFLNSIMIEVPGCSDPLARQMVLDAAGEFCQRTLAWDELADPVSLVDGERNYDIDAPTGARAFVVRDVWVDARQLKPVTMAELQSVLPAWRTATSTDPLFYNAALDREQLSVFPTPLGASGSQMVMRVALMPKSGATTLPDFLGTYYMDAITAGAKARLMAIPNQAFTNFKLVPLMRQQFDEGVFQACAESLHARVPGLVSVRPRQFGF